MEGLKERKKRRARQLLADTAMRLFYERGFDQVSVTEIAAAAEMSEKTVYNYFPTKAHLVFDEDPAALTGLIDAVRNRAAGQSALSAVRAYLSGLAERIGQAGSAEQVAAFRRLVANSPVLRAHQRQIAARYESSLAALLAEETGTAAGAAEPFLAAVALIGALRAGFEAAQESGGVRAAMDRALTLLETGLAGYAVASPRAKLTETELPA